MFVEQINRELLIRFGGFGRERLTEEVTDKLKE